MEHEKYWKYCKIVEQNQTGKLILHQNNLESLIDFWSKIKRKDEPITILSFVGPQSCGKSFFTNLFIEYIRMQSSLSWTKRIKREGLMGFGYGVEPNIITAKQLIPEQDVDSIYFYPELMKLNMDHREEFICILHVHLGKQKTSDKKIDMALDVLLAMISSSLINIIWNDKNTLNDINQLVTDSRYSPIKDQLTGNVIHLLRGEGVPENKTVIQLEESASLHDINGLLKVSYQQYSGLNNLMKAISTSVKQLETTDVTLSNILERLKDNVTLINDCNLFDTPLTSSTTEPFMENKPKNENGLRFEFENIESLESPVVEDRSLLSYLPDEDCQDQNIEKELPPLFCQIALTKVGIATLSQNSSETNSAPISIYSHPGEVGILIDGTWVCGNDVKEFKQQGRILKAWSFETLFNTYDFNDTVVISKDTVQITVPFLLSIFFLIMKQKAEIELNGKISAAMISVPYWFSFYKRTQIVEAGKRAGFLSVQLVNENTASAYFAYTSGLQSSENLVVISENSNRLDVSIYSFDKHSKVISMKGQTEDYEITEVSCPLKSFLKNQNETGICEEVFKSLYKLWIFAKSRVQSRFNLDNKIVFIFYESEQWREPLWKFAAGITSPGNISVRNDSPLFGLADIFHVAMARKISSIESLIRDDIPHSIIITQGNQQFVAFEKKNICFNSEIQDFSFKLPKSVGYFNFSSENDLRHAALGTLHLKYTIPPTFNIEITFKRINGTLILSSVNYVEIRLCGCNAPTKPLPDFYFEWQPLKTVVEKLGNPQLYLGSDNSSKTISEEVNGILTPPEEKTEKNLEVKVDKHMVVNQLDDELEDLLNSMT